MKEWVSLWIRNPYWSVVVMRKLRQDAIMRIHEANGSAMRQPLWDKNFRNDFERAMVIHA